LGEEGVESLLSATIEAAIKSKAVKSRDLKRVTVDTTVQEKAIAFPSSTIERASVWCDWPKHTALSCAKAMFGSVQGCCSRTTAMVMLAR